MSQLNIEVKPREQTGKGANRRLRAAGLVPAVVYGGGMDPAAIQVPHKQLQELLKGEAGENAVFKLHLTGTKKSRPTMIRDLQVDPITGELIHVDFQRVLLDQKVTVTVPIELHGKPVGVATEGGLLDFVTRDVEVECLPEKIPPHLNLEVGELHVGQHLEAGDLDLPDDVDLITEAERVIVSIHGRQEEEVEEEEGVEEEGLIERETEEPEVIGRAKADDDD